VHVEWNGHAPPHRLDNQRAEGDVGNEIAVHHVAVDTVRACVLRRLDLALETTEVSGEDGGKDLDTGGFHNLNIESRSQNPEEGIFQVFLFFILDSDFWLLNSLFRLPAFSA
jgi:hypothetical protein